MCSASEKEKSVSSTPPLVARSWVSLKRAIPNVNFPFTNLDVSFALASALLLASIRYMSEYIILVNFFGWPRGDTLTKEAAASCASICHSTTLCVGLIVAFLTQKYDPAGRMDQAPKWWQDFVDALLQFCTGYMIYDAIINIFWLRWDPATSLLPVLGEDDKLFLGHHIMTSLYMTSSRVVQAGHMSAMICMLLGELTNPLHNMFMLGEVAMKLDCCNGPSAQQIHSLVSVAFAAMYNLFRAIIAPIMLVYVTYCLLFTKKGRTNVPLPLNILWNLMIWAVVFGSGSWIVKCHGILLDFMAQYSSEGETVTKEL